MLERYEKNPIEATSAAFNILDMVSLNGSSYDAYFEPTQWSLVHNISDRTVTFKTRGKDTLKLVNINNINFSNLDSIKIFDLDRPDFGDITDKFINFSDDDNKKLIEKITLVQMVLWLRLDRYGYCESTWS